MLKTDQRHRWVCYSSGRGRSVTLHDELHGDSMPGVKEFEKGGKK